jgi:hypothetical protein
MLECRLLIVSIASGGHAGYAVVAVASASLVVAVSSSFAVVAVSSAGFVVSVSSGVAIVAIASAADHCAGSGADHVKR